MAAILYYSRSGHSLRLAKTFGLPCLNVTDNPDLSFHQKIILLSPVYGDEELSLEMEDYLHALPPSSKDYAICEVGNYYGYESREFGTIPIIRSLVEPLGWKEFHQPLSLDSLPRINWLAWNQWKQSVGQ